MTLSPMWTENILFRSIKLNSISHALMGEVIRQVSPTGLLARLCQTPLLSLYENSTSLEFLRKLCKLCIIVGKRSQ